MPNSRSEGERRRRIRLSMTWIITLVFVAVTITLIVLFTRYANRVEEQEQAAVYDRYYAMIVGDSDPGFWKAVYDGAAGAGRENNTYVELLGENLSTAYDRDDLMRIAIASSADGIILAADDSDSMTSLINEATSAGIPVVTLYSDNKNSNRCSFVWINYFDLGKDYGNQVLKLERNREDRERPLRVIVLENADGNVPDRFYSGLQDVWEKAFPSDQGVAGHITFTRESVDDTNDFSVEESVRNLLLRYREDPPDVLVCLSGITTVSAYQAVVDYNRVGEVNILGYYDSDAIINAVDRGVIYSTMSVDTAQMGRFCVNALAEYEEYGTASDFISVDVKLVDKANVSEHRIGRGE